MERRAEDSRVGKIAVDVTHLHECVELLKAEVKENTAITKEVRDILATFRIVGVVAKWLTIVGAALTMAYHGWQRLAGK